MKLIVARHGETMWNAQNKVLGRTDIPLTEKGLKQANALAESVKKYDISRVYSSPLGRAAKTAKVVADKTGAELSVTDVLIEQNFGIYEGVDRFDDEYQRAKRSFAKRYPEGESYFDVVARIYPFLEELKKEQAGDIMIVTHGGICRIINSYFEGMDNEEFASFAVPNCGYREYEF